MQVSVTVGNVAQKNSSTFDADIGACFRTGSFLDDLRGCGFGGSLLGGLGFRVRVSPSEVESSLSASSAPSELVLGLILLSGLGAGFPDDRRADLRNGFSINGALGLLDDNALGWLDDSLSGFCFSSSAFELSSESLAT